MSQEWKFAGTAGDECVLSDEVTGLVDAAGKEVLSIDWGGFACESDPHGAYPILKATAETWELIKSAPRLKRELAMLQERLAEALGWQRFPYLLLGPQDAQWMWCPPGAKVHISTVHDLPPLEQLLLDAAQLPKRVAELEHFARNVRDNYDHDGDAHKYGTPCRMCEAAKVLPRPLLDRTSVDPQGNTWVDD